MREMTGSNAKSFHEFFYAFSILNFNIEPSEFWKLTPIEFWLLYNEFAVIKGIKKTANKSEAERLQYLFDLPEARPSKAIKV